MEAKTRWTERLKSDSWRQLSCIFSPRVDPGWMTWSNLCACMPWVERPVKTSLNHLIILISIEELYKDQSEELGFSIRKFGPSSLLTKLANSSTLEYLWKKLSLAAGGFQSKVVTFVSITHWNHDRYWLQGTSRSSPLAEPPSTPNCPTLAAVIACWAGCWSRWMWTTATSIILSKDGENVKLDNFGASNSQWWGSKNGHVSATSQSPGRCKTDQSQAYPGHVETHDSRSGRRLYLFLPSHDLHELECQLEVNQQEALMRFCDPKIVTATCFQNEHPCHRPQRKQWNETRPSHLKAMKYRSSCCKRQVQMKKAHWQKSEVQIYVQH